MDRLPFRFENAAGLVKTPKLVRKIVETPLTTGVVAGSFTVNRRDRRAGGTDFARRHQGAAVNNLNLPNEGMPFLKECGREMVKITHGAGKEFIFNGSPFTPAEDAELAELAFEIGVDCYESNRGCPNTEKKGIMSYYREHMAESNECVARAIGRQRWRAKLSPYVNPLDREWVAELIIESTAEAVVTSNTIANSRLRGKDRRPLITANGTNGMGGLSGAPLHEIALLNAEDFCERLTSHGKHVIGVGGIEDCETLEDFRVVGCVGMEVGAALFESEDHPGVLQKIAMEWIFRYAS